MFKNTKEKILSAGILFSFAGFCGGVSVANYIHDKKDCASSQKESVRRMKSQAKDVCYCNPHLSNVDKNASTRSSSVCSKLSVE